MISDKWEKKNGNWWERTIQTRVKNNTNRNQIINARQDIFIHRKLFSYARQVATVIQLTTIAHYICVWNSDSELKSSVRQFVRVPRNKKLANKLRVGLPLNLLPYMAKSAIEQFVFKRKSFLHDERKTKSILE